MKYALILPLVLSLCRLAPAAERASTPGPVPSIEAPTQLPSAVIPAAPSAPAALSAIAAPSALALPPHVPDEAPVARLREHIASDLAKMALDSKQPGHPLLPAIYESANALLDGIDARLKAGEIDPSVDLRVSETEAPKPATGKTVRVGFYPIAGDPITWAHALVGLQAIDRLKLDKVVFVLAGDDPRKPNMTKAEHRHPIGQAVIDAFAPFFAYSPLAIGTTLDGESNIFRFLGLNAEQKLHAYYIVGDDHYRRFDKKGNPDTITKIEEKLAAHLKDSNGAPHDVSLAFTEREGAAEPVQTPLEVHVLPRIPFEASSTMVRNGQHVLMPHTAYDRARALGLYNLAIPGQESDGVRP